jgi:uncharacterized SAM-binding protein YcdF (DUF218 family)
MSLDGHEPFIVRRGALARVLDPLGRVTLRPFRHFRQRLGGAGCCKGKTEDRSMMFLLAKLIGELVCPSVMLLLLCCLGFALAQKVDARLGRTLLALGLTGYLAILVLPVDAWALLPFEDRFWRPTEPVHVDGIIVPSGAVDSELTRDRGIPTLNANAERMTEMVALARRHPEARLVFSGSNGALFPGNSKETDGARQLFSELGLDPNRIAFEENSRNTYENAVESKGLVQPSKESCWLLITSARHEPRAIGTFRRVGWRLLAWPVAYRSGRSLRAWMMPSMSERLENLDAAAHEWVGLLAYRLLDRISALLPEAGDAPGPCCSPPGCVERSQ